VRRTKRPLVLTQRGHSAAVLLDVAEYEQLLEEVETLRDVQLAEKQIAQGKGISHDRARQRILNALRR
jgi:PHD/YefM family antitoxin component YafN of YafNO toxin-antitoxin module